MKLVTQHIHVHVSYAHLVSERSPGNSGCLVDVIYVEILCGVSVEVSLHCHSREKIIKCSHVARLHHLALGYLAHLTVQV